MRIVFKKYIKLVALMAVLVLVAASCKVTKPYQRPLLPLDSLFRGQTGADTVTMATLPWQSLFADSVLRNLIREGLANNLNLKTAIQKIVEAQATFGQSKAAMLPSLSGNASVTRSEQSVAALDYPPGFNINTTTTAYQIGLSSSWEADVWGQLKSAKKAAFANLLESDAAKRAVQTQLIADIANNYYNLLALDKELEITQKALDFRIKDVETMKALKEADVVTGASVVQSEANRYEAEVSIPDLKRSIRETENTIDLLLGRPPGALKRNQLDDQKSSTVLQTGMSSQLLQNRPDVQQAEFAFRAAFENTNVARTYFYPQFTITASGGFTNLTLKDFFINSVFYNIAAGLTQPIFSQGANRARLKIAQAQQLEAMNSFQQSLLNAGSEVSNALYAYQTAVEKDTSRKREIVALTKAVDYTEQLLRYSSATNYTDVLTSEQALLTAQLSGVDDRLQQLQAIVNLYRALGGGWR